MKKLLLILLIPIMYLVSCSPGKSKDEITPVLGNIEEIIVGKTWKLLDTDYGWFHLNNNNTYLTKDYLCDTLEEFGTWELDGDVLIMKYTIPPFEYIERHTIIECRDTLVKIRADTSTTLDVNILFEIVPYDVVRGCMDSTAANYNPIAQCADTCIDNLQAAQDHLFAENIFNDINRVVEDGFNDNGLSKSSCADYTSMAADSSDADTLIIDFGEVDCLDEYGKLRRGKIIVIYTAPYQDSLSVITTTFDHYYVNNTNWVQGNRTITNLGRNSEGDMVFEIEVDANITSENGRIDWISNRTRIWTDGRNTTQYPFDDIYKVVGTASGNGLNNRAFTVNITNSLEVNLGCLKPTVTYNKRCVIVSGKVEITPDGYAAMEIDYGIGGCNCDFSVTINGETYVIVVP